jgi:hypothetical protein
MARRIICDFEAVGKLFGWHGYPRQNVGHNATKTGATDRESDNFD